MSHFDASLSPTSTVLYMGCPDQVGDLFAAFAPDSTQLNLEVGGTDPTLFQLAINGFYHTPHLTRGNIASLRQIHSNYRAIRSRNILVSSTCSANSSTDYRTSSLTEIQSSTVQAEYHIEALQSTNKDRNRRYCHNYSDEISIYTLCSCNWRPQLPQTPIWRTLPRPTTPLLPLLTQRSGRLMAAPKTPLPLRDRDIPYLRDDKRSYVEPMSGGTIVAGWPRNPVIMTHSWKYAKLYREHAHLYEAPKNRITINSETATVGFESSVTT
jgi:hypothetical protein